VSSANLLIELETCVATQSWVNRKYNRELGTQSCGAPVLRISVTEELFPTFTTWGRPIRKFRTQLHRVGFRPRALSLVISWNYDVEL
jgi:hypothetical protein